MEHWTPHSSLGQLALPHPAHGQLQLVTVDGCKPALHDISRQRTPCRKHLSSDVGAVMSAVLNAAAVNNDQVCSIAGEVHAQYHVPS